MATKTKGPKSDDNPRGSLSKAKLLDNQANNGKLITLELQWSKTAKKPEKYLEKSLKAWIQTKNKDLKCSVLKIQEDNNALIKIEPSSDAEILQKLSGEDLTIKDGTTVTVKHVTLGSPKQDTQTADDASTMSTPSTSDDKGQTNSQSDQVSIPEESSRDEKKNPKDGGVPDKHTLSSKSNTSDQIRQRDVVEHGAATSSDIQKGGEQLKADDNPAGSLSNEEVTEKCGKLILVLKWSDSAKKDPNDLEKSLKSWSKKECKGLMISVLKLLDDNNAVIKTQPYAAANLVKKLSGKNLHLKNLKRVTVESVILDSPKLDTQTADEASMSSTPLTSDDKGQMNGQSDHVSIPEESSRDENKNPKDGGVPDKHTHSSKRNTSVQTSKRDVVERGAATSSDIQKESEEKPKSSNPAGSPCYAELSDKKEKDEVPITLVLKWSKQTKKQQKLLETSLQSWFNNGKTGLSCSVVKILEDKNALIKIEPSPALETLQKLSGEHLSLQDGTTVTVESVVLGSSKLKPQADEASMTPTPSTSDGKGIRQNQEEAVPVPVGFFWYLSQVYKEEIKRIEKENGCEMEVTLNVTFKTKQKDGSQQNALSEFTNLVQNHFNESRESVIPAQNVRPEQCSEAFKLIQKNEKKVLLTLTPKEITVCGPDSAQLKSVLERNAPDEKPYLLHDDTPLKMTIKDPLADAGMKMEERTWKALDVDGKITKIKEKFDVDFQEVRRDGGKVQVKASYKGPEGNPFMESNAVRALLSLYQKSFTSSLNFTQLQGASGFMDWTKMHEDESEKRPVSEGGATGEDSTEDNCPICLSPFTDKKSLNCKHEFCNLCLQQAEKSNGPICPICRKVFGIIQGDQPDGSMSWFRSPGQVPGFSNCGIITITYSIPNGRQTEKHPKPGQWYTGTTRTAYLPDNKEGNEVLKLLKKAFDQKLIFTIGASRTTGYENQVTWNDIHHKTSLYGGPDSYGYPDSNYLSRVREELKAKGIE